MRRPGPRRSLHVLRIWLFRVGGKTRKLKTRKLLRNVLSALWVHSLASELALASARAGGPGAIGPGPVPTGPAARAAGQRRLWQRWRRLRPAGLGPWTTPDAARANREVQCAARAPEPEAIWRLDHGVFFVEVCPASKQTLGFVIARAPTCTLH